MKLRVRARGTSLVTDYKQLFNGVKAFVGWRHDPALGEDAVVHDEKGRKVRVRQGGFQRIDDVVEIDDPELAHMREYACAIADGDLWPGDEAAAEYAARMTGKPVKFDPTFGEPKPSKT